MLSNYTMVLEVQISFKIFQYCGRRWDWYLFLIKHGQNRFNSSHIMQAIFCIIYHIILTLHWSLYCDLINNGQCSNGPLCYWKNGLFSSMVSQKYLNKPSLVRSHKRPRIFGETNLLDLTWMFVHSPRHSNATLWLRNMFSHLKWGESFLYVQFELHS